MMSLKIFLREKNVGSAHTVAWAQLPVGHQETEKIS